LVDLVFKKLEDKIFFICFCICIDAIGMREQFEPVFENGNLALSASNDKFIRFNDEGDLVAMDDSATEANFIQIRSNSKRILEKDQRQKELPTEEQGSLLETEINYVRKFQKFQDKKLRIHQGDMKELVEAKSTGVLHEALLDRREKMKADRYCK
jgi:protein FRG1